MQSSPRTIAVFTILFPHPGQPRAGLFIRERMFRVAGRLPLIVIAPVPWFPLQGLIRRWRPHFRPPAPRREVQQGIVVEHPRYLSFPGIFKGLDGLCLALGALPTCWRRRHEIGVIDAHFAYPDGLAATWLGHWLGKPVTVTLRGTEVPHARHPGRRRQVQRTLSRADWVFAVSASLKQLAVELGRPAERIEVVGNGVDITRFQPVDKQGARLRYRIPAAARCLITVGGLVERKGFHRVIELMPALRARFPDLHYLIVGGPSAEGDWSERLRAMTTQLGLTDYVHFLGQIAPDELKYPLSAADVFVLPTRNEGWANVLLEALACGLPVVTTDVGGNAEVINNPALGMIVPFGDAQALETALIDALAKPWDTSILLEYAQANAWDGRVEALETAFRRLLA